ncbi:RHS repeat-associated core domain-containing protein [Aquimarina sp. Aq78]|uniref:RHS repeat-associated core domain-containing protein n=1 Tax=Aquimarina sp. Aq78 TaxID=1191889 RepID=UPI00131B1521|nr:RHS repeat-associated core domain-containing protein [Aquimarina sp. Aq78]
MDDISVVQETEEGIIVQQEKNYYPFGLEHKGYNNTITGREHNYGFNGKEENNELGLEWHDFGSRNFDTSLGRWINIDPLAEGYENWSPYSYAFNNPIYFIDPDGERIRIGNNDYSYEENRDYDAIEDDFERDTYKALDKLYSSDALNIDLNGDGEKTNLFDSLLGDDYDISIVKSKGKGSAFDRKTNDLAFSSSYGVVINKSGASKEELEKTTETGETTENTGINSPTAQLGHELVHGYNYNTDKKGYIKRRYDYSTSNRDDFTRPHYKNAEEKRTTTLSNQINTALGEPTRYDHRGAAIRTESPTSNKPLKVKADD